MQSEPTTPVLPPLIGHDGKPWPQTFDGATWAQEFLRHFPVGGYDEADLIGWFANAIMVGYDLGYGKGEAWGMEKAEVQAREEAQRRIERMGR